jgi:Glycosyltransferase family 87
MNRISAGLVLAQRPADTATAATAAPVSSHRQVVAWYAAFAGFAAVVFATSGEPVQRAWGAWAAGGYALAALTVALWRSRGREAALVMALAGALAAPLAWVTFGGKMSRAGDDSLQVVARSAILLLQHGTPYLPAGQISRALEYNPYEPAMAIFGLPAALGLHGAAGNPRLWMGLTAAVVIAAAFRFAKPGSALRSTAFAFGSPVLALPLTQGLTDLPVLALLSLTLACVTTDTRRRVWLAGAIALGAACAMKATAWPALPVIVAMLAARDGARTATKFAVTAGLTTTALVAATAPASVTAPAALFLNTVFFPLGMTRYQTDADSPLPGHLLAAATGSAGHWAAIGLLCAASLAVVLSLMVRPPADTGAVARRLAVTLAVLFALAPASRWGYFVYPAALLGFVSMTRSERGPWGAVLPQRADALGHLRRRCRVTRRGRRLVGVGEQLERLRIEPVPGRRIDLTPQRVESALPTCRDVPGTVGAVVPRPDAGGAVALAVGLARKLDPEVGID